MDVDTHIQVGIEQAQDSASGLYEYRAWLYPGEHETWEWGPQDAMPGPWAETIEGAVIALFDQLLEEKHGPSEPEPEQTKGEKTAIKPASHTVDDIRNLDPFRDLSVGLPANWTGTAFDILKEAALSPETRLDIALHEGWVARRVLQRFAYDCAERTVALWRHQGGEVDGRVSIALLVLHHRLVGGATREEVDLAGQLALRAATELRYSFLHTTYRVRGAEAAPAVAAAFHDQPGVAAREVAYHLRQAASDVAWQGTLKAAEADKARRDMAEWQVAHLIELLEGQTES